MLWIYVLLVANLVSVCWFSLKLTYASRVLEHRLDEQDEMLQALTDSALDGDATALKHLRGKRRLRRMAAPP